MATYETDKIKFEFSYILYHVVKSGQFSLNVDLMDIL